MYCNIISQFEIEDGIGGRLTCGSISLLIFSTYVNALIDKYNCRFLDNGYVIVY